VPLSPGSRITDLGRDIVALGFVKTFESTARRFLRDRAHHASLSRPRPDEAGRGSGCPFPPGVLTEG